MAMVTTSNSFTLVLLIDLADMSRRTRMAIPPPMRPSEPASRNILTEHARNAAIILFYRDSSTHIHGDLLPYVSQFSPYHEWELMQT